MSEQNPYETLGITADASFEDVQSARDRLLAGANSDSHQAEVIESAYDAVLMERLRLRQEGKIKVPEIIRFPDRPKDKPPSLPMAPMNPSSSWVRNWWNKINPSSPGFKNWWQSIQDTPSRSEVLWCSGVFAGLSALSWLLPYGLGATPKADAILQLCLALGLGYSLYFLNRKENRFGRALLFSLVGLLVGLILGSAVLAPVEALLPSVGLTVQQGITVFTFFVLWLITSFLR